jgi:hypothetical protein
MWPFTKQAPEKNLYEKRIECLEKMLELERLAQNADKEYIEVSSIEGKPHENAYTRLGIYQKTYSDLYEKCEPMLK